MYIIERRESHFCGVWVQNQQMSNCGYVAGIQANFRNINNCQLLSITDIGPCVFHIICRVSQKKVKDKIFCGLAILVPKTAQGAQEYQGVQKGPRWPESAQSCQTSKNSILNFFGTPRMLQRQIFDGVSSN